MANDRVVKTALTLARDILTANRIPGGATLALLIDNAFKRRYQAALDTLFEEIEKSGISGTDFSDREADNFVQMLLRFDDAVQKGTARENLRFLSKVIVGLKRHHAFEFDNFQKWAAVLEGLTRDELLILGVSYRIQQKEGHFWTLLINELVPSRFPLNRDVETICAALLRTGLILPKSAMGGLIYEPGNGLDELCKLAELDQHVPTK